MAGNDLYAATEDTPLVVAAPGVLLNDSGLATGQAYTAVLVAAPQNGTVLLNPDGSFTYTPAANYQRARLLHLPRQRRHGAAATSPPSA